MRMQATLDCYARESREAFSEAFVCKMSYSGSSGG